MSTKGLKQLAEKRLGAEIGSGEFAKAKELAEEKLEEIIGEEGDAGGKRREPRYLAVLIADVVVALRWKRYVKSFLEPDEVEVKKEQPG